MPIVMARPTGQTPIDQRDVDQKRKLAELLQLMATQPNQQAIASQSPLLAAITPFLSQLSAHKAQNRAQASEQELMGQQQSEIQRILGIGEGTPPQMVDKPISGPTRPGEDLGSVQSMTPGIPGDRNAMIRAALGSRVPFMQQFGAQAMLKEPQGTWEQVPGPRGSLLQRHSITGETKQVIPTTDPRMMEIIMQGLLGGRGQQDPSAPWSGIADSKKRDEARLRFGMEADKAVEKANEDAANSQAIINDLDRFLFLNERSPTGGKFKIPGAKSVATGFSEDYAEMQGISDRLTPMMRQGLPGAASDRDVAMFRGGTVTLEKQPEANKNIALGLKIAHQNKIDRANFLAKYVTDKGYSRKADAEWRAYLNANPIFDHSQPKGSFVLNPNRMSYEEWAASGQGETNRVQGSPAPSGLTPQERSELEQLRKELNR